VGASVSFGKTISNGAVSSGGGEGSFTGLIQSIYTERPIAVFSPSEDEYNQGYVTLNTMVTDKAYKNIGMSRLLGNAYLDYKFTPDLKLRISASGNTSNSKLQEFYSAETKWGRVFDGIANITNVNTESFTLSGTLNYTKRFDKKHDITGLLGGELNGYHNERFGTRSTSFEDETTGVFDISKGSVVDKPTSSVAQINRMSAFGRATYSYMYKYYLTVNIRADASSNFQSGSRLGYFPSVSAAWRVNSERFLKSIDAISNLKLRASVGSTGNDRIASYGALASMMPNYYSSNGATINGMSPYTSENKNLKWESTYQYDLGLRLALFNNRISLVGDVYLKDTRDMLFKARVPSQSGFTEQWQNIGRLTNRGLELSLITRNIESKKLTWTTTVNFDLNRNKVISLGDAQFLPITISNGSLKDVAG